MEVLLGWLKCLDCLPQINFVLKVRWWSYRSKNYRLGLVAVHGQRLKTPEAIKRVFS